MGLGGGVGWGGLGFGEDVGSSGIGIPPNGEEDFHEGSRGELLFRAKKPPPAANIVRRRNFAAFDALRAQASALASAKFQGFWGCPPEVSRLLVQILMLKPAFVPVQPRNGGG